MQEDEGNSGSFPEIPRPRTSETEMLLDRDNPFRKIAVVQQEEEVDDVGPRRSDPPPLVSGSGPRENSKRGPPSGPLALSSGNFDRRQHPTSSGRVAKDSVTSPGNSTASAPASQSEEYDYPTDYNKDIRSERFAASEFSCRKLCQNPVAVTLIILGTLLLITIVGTSAWCCIIASAAQDKTTTTTTTTTTEAAHLSAFFPGAGGAASSGTPERGPPEVLPGRTTAEPQAPTTPHDGEPLHPLPTNGTVELLPPPGTVHRPESDGSPMKIPPVGGGGARGASKASPASAKSPATRPKRGSSGDHAQDHQATPQFLDHKLDRATFSKNGRGKVFWNANAWDDIQEPHRSSHWPTTEEMMQNNYERQVLHQLWGPEAVWRRKTPDVFREKVLRVADGFSQDDCARHPGVVNYVYHHDVVVENDADDSERPLAACGCAFSSGAEDSTVENRQRHPLLGGPHRRGVRRSSKLVVVHAPAPARFLLRFPSTLERFKNDEIYMTVDLRSVAIFQSGSVTDRITSFGAYARFFDPLLDGMKGILDSGSPTIRLARPVWHQFVESFWLATAASRDCFQGPSIGVAVEIGEGQLAANVDFEETPGMPYWYVISPRDYCKTPGAKLPGYGDAVYPSHDMISRIVVQETLIGFRTEELGSSVAVVLGEPFHAAYYIRYNLTEILLPKLDEPQCLPAEE